MSLTIKIISFIKNFHSVKITIDDSDDDYAEDTDAENTNDSDDYAQDEEYYDNKSTSITISK